MMQLMDSGVQNAMMRLTDSGVRNAMMRPADSGRGGSRFSTGANV